MTTTTMNADAQRLFDRYLQTVRWSVRGVADADEIERDVRDHVASALAEREAPVSSDTLREVLSRLGDPWQWVPIDELPMWRRAIMRLWLGPDDWRLAYICFGLTLLGLILLPVGVGAVLLVGAYLLARATTEIAADRDGSLGARRWLVYPPIVAFCAIAAGALLIGLAAPAIAWGVGEHGFRYIFYAKHLSDFEPIQRNVFYAAGAAITLGTWWVALSALAAVLIGPVRFLFAPLAAGLRRVHMLWLTGLGAILIAAGAIALLA